MASIPPPNMQRKREALSGAISRRIKNNQGSKGGGRVTIQPYPYNPGGKGGNNGLTSRERTRLRTQRRIRQETGGKFGPNERRHMKSLRRNLQNTTREQRNLAKKASSGNTRTDFTKKGSGGSPPYNPGNYGNGIRPPAPYTPYNPTKTTEGGRRIGSIPRMPTSSGNPVSGYSPRMRTPKSRRNDAQR